MISDCSTINKGPMDCWTDAQGQVQCPNNDGGYDNCKELEDNPNCGFLREACLEGAERDGICFVKEQTWDCGTLHSIPVLKREQSIKCAGPVRCMGADCVDPNSEQSADLAKAVAALEAAQMMATDMQCDPGGNCVVFNGERNECKRAVGGIVNCCKTPEGVSLGNYLTLIFALAKLDSAIMGMNKGGAIRGSWEALRQPLTSTWTAVKEPFSSVANSLTGATTEAATDAAAQGVLELTKQEVLSKTVTWAAQTFGEGAVNVLFSGLNGGAAISNGTVSSALQLGRGQAWLGSVMAWAMYAYTIYTVAMILIKIIWTCEKKEFELGAKRELKACHNVGGYCKSKVLGWCIEKRDTYCCFNTPLARILNEQIRPQLGRGWGSPKNPDCKGINVQDFSRVDWSRVNLDEWLAILFETGHFPTAETINLERLTGSGSVLSGGGDRANSVERSVDRTTGLDAEQTRRDAEEELWSDALAGCASAPKVYDSTFQENPRYSRAMNVLMAAGYVNDSAKSPMRDAPQAKVAQAAKSGGPGGLDVAYAVSSALAPPPGIGFGFGLGMGVVSVLAPSPVEPLSRSMIVAWMPRNQASDQTEATSKIEALLKQAMEEAIKARLEAPFTIGPPKLPGRFEITGGACSENNNQCKYEAYFGKIHAKPVAAMAPGMLGGGQAWTWHVSDLPSEALVSTLLSSVKVSGDWTKPHRDWLPDLAIYQDWSKRLPEWVFIYLAPTTPISLGNGQGFLKFPVVLNKGEALYFVSPGA